jgi:hypothetical protein
MYRGCIRKNYVESHWFRRYSTGFLQIFTEFLIISLLLVWKISSVVPIPIPYCPISILPVLAKAFENVMYEHIVNYVSQNGLISSFQSGYRPGHSTVTAIARVSDDIRLNMEANQPTILVLLDFSKAFDSVCHGLYIFKLHRRQGFCATVATLISSYLYPWNEKIA